MIDALIEEGACSVPCTLDYGISKTVACGNCIYNPIGNKSSNRYKSGGPVPFPNGQTCPMCNGSGRIGNIETEDVDLIVIMDYKKWLDFGNANANTSQTPAGNAQTISGVETYAQIKRARTALLSTNLSNYEKHKFQRAGEPNICGIGDKQYVITMWERLS